MARLNAAFCLDTTAKEMEILNISFPRVGIEPTTCRIYNYTLCPCATTGLVCICIYNLVLNNVYIFVIYILYRIILNTLYKFVCILGRSRFISLVLKKNIFFFLSKLLLLSNNTVIFNTLYIKS